jgi:hypothetical protein
LSNDEVGMQISQVNVHVGVQFNFQVLGSINAKRHQCLIEWHPWGVKITPTNSKVKTCVAVYASNIKWIDLTDAEPVNVTPIESPKGKKK